MASAACCGRCSRFRPVHCRAGVTQPHEGETFGKHSLLMCGPYKAQVTFGQLESTWLIICMSNYMGNSACLTFAAQINGGPLLRIIYYSYFSDHPFTYPAQNSVRRPMYTTKETNPKNVRTRISGWWQIFTAVQARAYLGVGCPFDDKRNDLPKRWKGKQLSSPSTKSGEAANFSPFTALAGEYMGRPRLLDEQPAEARKLGFGSHDANRRSEFSAHIPSEQYRQTIKVRANDITCNTPYAELCRLNWFWQPKRPSLRFKRLQSSHCQIP